MGKLANTNFYQSWNEQTNAKYAIRLNDFCQSDQLITFLVVFFFNDLHLQIIETPKAHNTKDYFIAIVDKYSRKKEGRKCFCQKD